MNRIFKKRSQKAGLPPGTLIHIGEKKLEKPRITLVEYDEDHYEEKVLEKIEDIPLPPPLKKTRWINVEGIHEVRILEKLGELYQIHPLVLEDILNTDQRPKVEDLENYLFVVLRILNYDDQKNVLVSEQASFILLENLVISFLESSETQAMTSVRDRLRNAKGTIRKEGADRLVYSLMDSIVDHYFVVLEKTGERIESLEEHLVVNPTSSALSDLHVLKREMIYFRKSVWPLREVIAALERGESPLIRKATMTYLRDLYDHTIQIIDNVETYRDMLSGMLDIYLSSLSNRMNEVMKVLTIIATLFMPITFLAGIYGMNFRYMPELFWHWGYFFTWGIMLSVVVVMLFYFRRKKWL